MTRCTSASASGRSPSSLPTAARREAAFHRPERRILIVGDVLIGNSAWPLRDLRDKVMDDPTQLRASVRRLLELDFDTLLVGDGVPILSGAKQCLRELVDSWS
jgi:glyoxylase-like metal-dependent hydrolase (beta-lactamase superfamily II)